MIICENKLKEVMSVNGKVFSLLCKLRYSVFPKRCPFCDAVIGNDECACSDCKNNLPEKGFATYTSSGVRCVSPFLYEGVYAKAVKLLKFHNRKYYTDSLAHFIAEEVKRRYGDIQFDIITSVPRYKGENRKSRNCSKRLAIAVSHILNIRYEETLIKDKQNQKQHNLPKTLRKTNVQGVYKLRDEALVKGKKVLICDDIITTGFTLGECCTILKSAKPALLLSCSLCAAQKFRKT